MFEEYIGQKIKTEGNVIIMFHLPGHCAGCSFVLKALKGKDFPDWTIYLVDAEKDENRPLIDKYEAITAPTLIVIKNGEVVDKIAGLKEFRSKQEQLFS